MICYRGRTYCIATCAARACRDRLTPAVQTAARAWWGGGNLPISMANFSESCDGFLPSGEESEWPLNRAPR